MPKTCIIGSFLLTNYKSPVPTESFFWEFLRNRNRVKTASSTSSFDKERLPQFIPKNRLRQYSTACTRFYNSIYSFSSGWRQWAHLSAFSCTYHRTHLEVLWSERQFFSVDLQDIWGVQLYGPFLGVFIFDGRICLWRQAFCNRFQSPL